ncbi:hypothetical protein [Klebsiella pneumoniae]|uniref:hypothetical protein n=1 Tax=Klebsiella pneumoniae TaxID=573 RepID=UPI00294967F2|nr:hypothetical protein [Klebsiella pneumoniae]MDV5722802.1 hypothetical protein [Klebsiella pneumoniae]
MFWIGADETGWNAGRSVVINEPEYDDKGIAILTLHDIEWRDSTTIRRFRFDFTSGQDADNYLLFDWIAVGRPTPGAGMAALQEEQQARANADTAEAQARSTLAAQIRGSSESGNLDDIRSGLIYHMKINVSLPMLRKRVRVNPCRLNSTETKPLLQKSCIRCPPNKLPRQARVIGLCKTKPWPEGRCQCSTDNFPEG